MSKFPTILMSDSLENSSFLLKQKVTIFGPNAHAHAWPLGRLHCSVILKKRLINEKLSYFKNKTQLCDPFDNKLRDGFIVAVFAYHNLL